jgi:hypothetical protein
MAWSSASLSADEVSNAAADNPLAVGLHALSGSSLAAEWNDTGSLADTDDSATGYPAANAADFRGSVPTKPTGTDTDWYWCADLGASGVPDVDMALLLGHNMGTLGGMTVTLQIADDSAFSTNLQTIATWSPGTSTLRLVSYTLKHTGSDALRYSSLRYVRLRFQNAGAVTPSFGELWLGRRRQLTVRPTVGYDETEAVAAATDFVADDRSSIRYQWADGIGRRVLDFPALSSTDAATVKSLRDDCKRGGRPVLWCDKPASEPDRTMLMLPPPELRRPNLGGSKRSFTMTLNEQDTFRELEA